MASMLENQHSNRIPVRMIWAGTESGWGAVNPAGAVGCVWSMATIWHGETVGWKRATVSGGRGRLDFALASYHRPATVKS